MPLKLFVQKTRMPSLEVAPTTVPQRTRQPQKFLPLLHIYTFKFKSDFIRQCLCLRCLASKRACAAEDVFHPVKFFSFLYRELWPITLTFELHLDRIKVNHHAKYRKCHFVRKLFSGHIHTHARTHTHITDQLLYVESGPLKLSVKLNRFGVAICKSDSVILLCTKWQWRNFFISYLCQLFSRHFMGQALLNVCYCNITFLVR